MPKPRKYKDLYGAQEVYLKTEKGKQARSRYENSDKRKIQRRDWARKRRGTIVDKQQWFIDNYGDVEKALEPLENREQRIVIELYYGLSNQSPKTQTEIATILGTSQPKVSQIINKARKKLEPISELSIS